MPRRTLTPEDRERIVELKLQRIPVRSIADQVECAPGTVQTVWHKYLAERSTERKKDLDQGLEEALARAEQNALDARRGYQTALREKDLNSARGFLAAERQAIETIARLGGFDKQTIELTGQINVQIAQEQAQQITQLLRRVVDRLPLTPEGVIEARTIIAEEVKRLTSSSK